MLDLESPVMPRRVTPRLVAQNEAASAGPVSDVLAFVREEMGVVPNGIATMANSPAVARAYLAFAKEMAGGVLPARVRQQIALVISEANRCWYCESLHTALGVRAGLNPTEALSARRGFSTRPREREAMAFALAVQTRRGAVTDAEFRRVRNAGYSDGEITEIVGHVALNMLTNTINRVAGTPIDFPLAPELGGNRAQKGWAALRRILRSLRASIRHEFSRARNHVEN